MTSSFASVCSDISEHGGDTRAFTEADWNETASETYLPYHASKVRAERRAYEIEKEARGAWTLATICPPVRRRSGSRERERAKEREGERKEKTRRLVHPRSSSFLFLQKNEKTVFLQIVQGPPVGNIKTETIGLQRRLLSGAHYPWVPRIGMAFVDVDDVAFAHCNAAFAPNARGRYLISAPEPMFMLDYSNLLKPEYAERKLPFLTLPMWLLWFAVKVLGHTKATDYDLIAASAFRLPRFDTGKAARDLGLTEYFPVKKTAIDLADALCRLGIVKGGRAAGAGARKQD